MKVSPYLAFYCEEATYKSMIIEGKVSSEIEASATEALTRVRAGSLLMN